MSDIRLSPKGPSKIELLGPTGPTGPASGFTGSTGSTGPTGFGPTGPTGPGTSGLSVVASGYVPAVGTSFFYQDGGFASVSNPSPGVYNLVMTDSAIDDLVINVTCSGNNDYAIANVTGPPTTTIVVNTFDGTSADPENTDFYITVVQAP